MASIPPDKLQEVRDRVDIERVIGRTVPLKKQGARLVGLCPFHSEKSPSFSVDAVKKLFHCFGCQAGGDVFDFVQRVEGVEFPEAVRIVARETGVVLPERAESDEERRIRTERERLFRINDLAMAFFERCLWADPRALAYLREERKLTDDTIRAWHLGFAPDSWSAMSDALIAKGVTPEQLVRLGLSGRRREGHGIYDKLRGRVIFPIAVPGGGIAGFGGRRADWLHEEEGSSVPRAGSAAGAEGARSEAKPTAAPMGRSDRASSDRGPKYLNSPESPIYDKSSIFYGLAEARDAIRRSKRAIMVEGYLDVIALHQAGTATAVATCGTAMSGKHAAQLTRLTEEVVTLYDGDPAGQQATRRAAEILLATGLAVRVVTLPEGEDPDTFVHRFGSEELERRLNEAPSAIDHAVEAAAKRNAGAGIAGLVRIVEEVRPLLLAVKDPLKRDLFVSAAAQRLKIDPRMLLQHLRRPQEPVRLSERDVMGAPMRDRPRPPQNDAPPPGIESALLRLLVENPERFVRAVEAKSALDAFCHPAVKAAVLAAVRAVHDQEPFDAQRALDAVRAAGASERTVGFLRETLVNSPSSQDDLEESLKNLLRREYERRLRDLQRRIALEQDPEAAERLGAEVNEVVRAKASLK